jgi:hypothetical protein
MPRTPHPVPLEPAYAPDGQALPLPHERDEKTGELGHHDDPRMKQAKRDLDAGQVDTDMRATPGLDAEQRERLVPTPTTPDKPANADPRTPQHKPAKRGGPPV